MSCVKAILTDCGNWRLSGSRNVFYPDALGKTVYRNDCVRFLLYHHGVDCFDNGHPFDCAGNSDHGSGGVGRISSSGSDS